MNTSPMSCDVGLFLWTFLDGCQFSVMPSEGLNEKFSGRGADGSTPVLGTGGFRFDPELPDFEN